MVPTALAMKSNISWDVTPCSLVEISRRLGETYFFHLKGREVNREIKQAP
jgi:hypothetical protein